MRWRRFLRRGYWDDERARELAAHLAHEIDENRARGMAPDQARTAAYRKLGNPTRIREEIYDMNTLRWLDAAWRDLRYGVRVLRRNPLFAAVTILSLALGIGANTAIFQILDAVEFRRLPVRAPEQLVEIRPTANTRWGNSTGRQAQVTNAIWEEIRRNQRSFAGVFAWGVTAFDLSSGGQSRFIDGLWVSGESFDVLGVTPYRGRVLSTADDRPGCGSPTAVISYAFWQREYGGALSAVGTTIRLNRQPLQIVGVTPPEFFGIEVGRSFDVAVPICAEPLIEPVRNAVAKPHYWWLDVFGRLRPGETTESVNPDLAALSPAILRAAVAPQFPVAAARQFLAMTFRAFPAGTGVSYLRRVYEQPLRILLAVAGLVLLIACANLASLMLARATAREREIAVRLAIGASRGRLVRQLLVESVVIAGVGAACGMLIAQSLSRSLVAYISTDSSRLFFDLGSDWRVLAFTSSVAAAACLLVGLAPALRATRRGASAAMTAHGRGITDPPGRFELRRVLVAAQVALSLVLLVGSLLFVRTMRNLSTVDPGFRVKQIVIADFDPTAAHVPPPLQAQFERALRQRIAAVPGVEAVADAAIEPLSGSVWNNRVVLNGAPQETTYLNYVSPGFFRLLGISVLAGRDFTEGDLPGTALVALVNQSFARKFLGTANPLGRTFKLEAAPRQVDRTYEVIGLVANTKYADVRDAVQPIAYFAEAQIPQPDATLSEAQVFVRSPLPLSSLAPAITAASREVSPAMLVSYRAFADDIRGSFLRERLMATLSGFFAALAALLATIGLYGVMAYMVARRRNEIGIRLALGAEAHRIVAMIMREAGVLLAIGLCIGGALAVLAGGMASDLFYGVRPWDPASFACASVALTVAGLLAGWWPARRAARIDPTEALRQE